MKGSDWFSLTLLILATSMLVKAKICIKKRVPKESSPSHQPQWENPPSLQPPSESSESFKSPGESPPVQSPSSQPVTPSTESSPSLQPPWEIPPNLQPPSESSPSLQPPKENPSVSNPPTESSPLSGPPVPPPSPDIVVKFNETSFVRETVEIRTTRLNYNPTFQCPDLSDNVTCVLGQGIQTYRIVEITTVNGVNVSREFIKNMYCCNGVVNSNISTLFASGKMELRRAGHLTYYPEFQCPNLSDNVTCLVNQTINTYKSWNITTVNGVEVARSFIENFYCCEGEVGYYVNNTFLSSKLQAKKSGFLQYYPEYQCPQLDVAVICVYNQTINTYRSFNVTTVNGIEIKRDFLENLYCCKGEVKIFLENTLRSSRLETRKTGRYNPNLQCPNLNVAVVCVYNQTINTYRSVEVTTVDGIVINRVLKPTLYCCARLLLNSALTNVSESSSLAIEEFDVTTSYLSPEYY